MSNTQQTAVEYYSKEIGRLTSDLITGKITGKQFVMLEIQLLEQAKEMQKELMKGMYVEGSFAKMRYYDGLEYIDAEQYYNETYGGGEQ
jgi:phage regulator Rha-like protein